MKWNFLHHGNTYTAEHCTPSPVRSDRNMIVLNSSAEPDSLLFLRLPSHAEDAAVVLDAIDAQFDRFKQIVIERFANRQWTALALDSEGLLKVFYNQVEEYTPGASTETL